MMRTAPGFSFGVAVREEPTGVIARAAVLL